MSESGEKSEPTEGERILADLLTREVPEEEKFRIKQLESVEERDSRRGTTYSEHWRNFERLTGDILREKLNDKLLIDLGGGTSLMRGILQEEAVAIKGYVNVDKFAFTADKLDGKTKQGIDFAENGRDINVRSGMLNFLQYIADGSVDAISLNGIDAAIIPDGDYHDELVLQIERVLKPNGVVMGICSEPIKRLLLNPNFGIDWKAEWDVENSSAILEKNK